MSQKKPSLKDRALAAIGNPGPLPSSTGTGSPSTARTGPGALMAHLARESDAQKENDRLRSELEAWSGAAPVRRLDPTLVEPSRWANRHQDSFAGPEFESLKLEIAAAGGNVQPIKVRPLPGDRFEIVFGHRRHRACLDLGLQVAALIESIDEKTLFAEMDRENRLRADLRPYEQGEMYRRALEEGLFPSLRALAEAVGVDAGNASKAVALARLPNDILDAFPSRLDLQYRWATVLSKMLAEQGDMLRQRAKDISRAVKSGKPLTASEVFDRLAGLEKTPAKGKASVKEFVGASGTKAFWRSGGGRQVIEIRSDEIGPKARERLEQAIRAALDS